MKKKLDTHVDNEGILLDYESEPEMFEEYILEHLENELRNSTDTL